MFWFAAVVSTQSDSASSVEWSKALAPVIASLIAVIGVAATIAWSIRKGAIDARYQYASKMLDLRLRQLGEFYAPMRIQLEQSRILYRKLLWVLKRINDANHEPVIRLDGFRLLDHAFTILDDERFAEAKPLVEAILKIGQGMAKLIGKNGGLIEGGMTDTFTEYRAHFRMLEIASETKPPLPTTDGWQEFGYYPRMLNREVAEGFKEVLRHLHVYQDAGDNVIWELLGRVPEPRRDSFRTLMENLRYYEANAETYAQTFDSFDASPLMEPFIGAIKTSHVEVGGVKMPRAILDAGCGTGRDAENFIKRGFVVTAFDVSPAMVRKCARRIRLLAVEDGTHAACAKKSGCEEMTFDEVWQRNQFDGIWASASLLHLSKLELPDSLKRLANALKPGGAMFMSFKHGKGEAEFDARHYSYFTQGEIEGVVDQVASLAVSRVWLSDQSAKEIGCVQSFWEQLRIKVGGPPKYWINVLVKKS